MENQSNTSPDDAAEARAARRAVLAAKLDEALAAAEQLRMLASSAYPEAAAEVERMLAPAFESLGTAAKLALGEQAAEQLFQLSMALAPESTLEYLERGLPNDVESRNSAQNVIECLCQARPAKEETHE